MTLDIGRGIAAMRRMSTAQLKARYQETIGEPARSGHREHLIRRIAWRLQALEEGALPERAQRRAEELARGAQLRLHAPRKLRRRKQVLRKPRPKRRDPRLPMTGTILVRQYLGRTRQVLVLDTGFEYEGRTFSTLTAVTRHITGQRWNGFHFFGLARSRGG